jgi:hypothetical protein
MLLGGNHAEPVRRHIKKNHAGYQRNSADLAPNRPSRMAGIGGRDHDRLAYSDEQSLFVLLAVDAGVPAVHGDGELLVFPHPPVRPRPGADRTATKRLAFRGTPSASPGGTLRLRADGYTCSDYLSPAPIASVRRVGGGYMAHFTSGPGFAFHRLSVRTVRIAVPRLCASPYPRTAGAGCHRPLFLRMAPSKLFQHFLRIRAVPTLLYLRHFYRGGAFPAVDGEHDLFCLQPYGHQSRCMVGEIRTEFRSQDENTGCSLSRFGERYGYEQIISGYVFHQPLSRESRVSPEQTVFVKR